MWWFVTPCSVFEKNEGDSAAEPTPDLVALHIQRLPTHASQKNFKKLVLNGAFWEVFITLVLIFLTTIHRRFYLLAKPVLVDQGFIILVESHPEVGKEINLLN